MTDSDSHRISLVGGGDAEESTRRTARSVGRELGRRGHVLVCGGLGGVMEAACRGAAEADGRSVGILPGEETEAANPYVETPIATGLGHARNALVVLNGEAVVAVDGGPGTLSELGYAGVYDRPVAAIDSHDVPGVAAVGTAAEAVDYVERALERR